MNALHILLRTHVYALQRVLFNTFGTTANSSSHSRRMRRETGQASVEYALVLLGAALVATLLISWATSTNLISSLFDYILGLIRGKAK
jgi:Flp pilus assembly pilin Flp